MGSRLSPLPAEAAAAGWLAAHREPAPARAQTGGRPVGLTLPQPHGFADVRMRLPVHPLQIGTLALWLTAAGAGLCGLLFEGWHQPHEVTVAHGPSVVMAELAASDAGGGAPEPDSGQQASALPLPVEPTFESPPQLVDNVALKPLPDLPPMPAAVSRPSPGSPGSSAAPRPASTSVARSGQPPARPSGGTAAASASSGGMSLAARLAAGSMPAAYPPEARRRGQEGTVMIEFTISESGRVTGASVLKASPWPLLNAAALQAVRGWKFPPGEAVRMQRPIVYQLR